MKKLIIPDSGPLGEITNAKLDKKVEKWKNFIEKQEYYLRIAEINDYELRRNYLLEDLDKSLNRLNRYKQTKQFIPLNSEMLLVACELWAWSRSKGFPTSDSKRLDGDTILVAQALSQKDEFDQVIIVTNNLKHFVNFIEFGIVIWDWKQALVDCVYEEINLYKPDLKNLL